jgi:RimJ/RimL family protein N-acetyltransferase
MKYLFGQHEIVADFVAWMIPHVRERGFGNCRAIGIVDDDDELIAGLVYHHLSIEAQLMEISGAALPGKQWATRETLRIMHEYPFLQCGCQMVVMKVLASDERLLRMLAMLGYRFITLPRLFGRERDGVYCYLTYENWCANKIAKRLERKKAQEQIEKEAA